MKRDFYHYFLFSDPTGNQPSQHKFCDDLLAPLGCARMPALFHDSIFADDDFAGNGPIDERKFRKVLASGDNNGKIPRDCRCWLNIENVAHNVWRALPEFPWVAVQQEGIDFFHHVLDVAENERPDAEFGLFGQVPTSGYQLILGTRLEETWEEILVACRPLARRLGFLLPVFYDDFVWHTNYNTFADRLKWIERVLTAARYHYPGMPVIGMPCMEYLDLWKAKPIPDTPEHQKARRLSGWNWHQYNKLILEMADGVLWWGGEGGTPFPFDTDFWEVTKELLGST